MSQEATVLKKGGRSMTGMGIVAVLLGLLAMSAPGLAGLSVAMVVGILMIAGGLMRMFWAFTAGTLGKGLLVFAIGGLTLLCGIALTANPLFASGVLALVLTAYFIVDGIVEILAGVQRRPERGSGWLIFAGVVSLLLGVMIWRQFPFSGAWAIGILIGVKLLFVGLIMIGSGTSARALGASIDR